MLQMGLQLVVPVVQGLVVAFHTLHNRVDEELVVIGE